MSNIRRLPALILLAASLSSCGLSGNAPAPTAALLSPAALDTYNFEVTAGFQLASVDSADASVVDQAKAGFAADLKAGHTSDYQRDKDFSIQLLSGSEGNYFTSTELLQSSVQQVLATLVVMQDNQAAQIFKGQYDNQRFVFADPADQFALDTRTKAYLLTADANFTIQTYKGELVPDSEIAAANAAPTTSTAAASTAATSTAAASAAGAPTMAYNGVGINYDPNAEMPAPPLYPLFPQAWNMNDDRYAPKMPLTRAWSGTPAYGGEIRAGVDYDPMRTGRAYNGPALNGPMLTGPMSNPAELTPVPGKTFARAAAPQPMTRMVEAGWFDAGGNFHAAEKIVSNVKVDDTRRAEAVKDDKRVKLPQPGYAGPGSPPVGSGTPQ